MKEVRNVVGAPVVGQKAATSHVRGFASLIALLTLVTSFAVSAAGGAYTAELVAQRIKSSSAISSLGDDLFGDQVDWYSGSTLFAVTDVSLPGNGSLPVAVGRIHQVGTQGPASLGLFGNWDIDIPYIHATFLRNEGWASSSCSMQYSAPPVWMTLPNTGVANIVWGDAYWDGSRMHLPGAGDRLMLRTRAAIQVPQGGASYPWTTTDNWRFSCIPIKRGAGEGFLAHSPDGTRYFFDVGYAREVVPLIWHFFGEISGGGSYYAGEAFVWRRKFYLYPSRIEDRFGNSVDFNWEMSSAIDPRLHSIVANDGRRIDIKYKWIEPGGIFIREDASGYKVESITANGKSWHYDYDASALLTKVTLPDESTWTLSPTSGNPGFVSGSGNPCNGLTMGSDIFQYIMKHPSGAQGKFLFKMTAHGRAEVSPKCQWDDYKREDKNHSPGKLFAVLSLHRKEISGPSMSPRVWTVAWNSTPANDASWKGENTGDTTKIVELTAPGGAYTRYTFSNYFDRDEGKLLKEETGTGPYHILSTTEHTYDVDSPSPAYIREIGVTGYWGHNPQDRRVIPRSGTKITQDGRTFSTAVEAYDSFARPIQVRHSSEQLSPPPPPIDPEPIDPPPCSECEIP